MKPALRQVGRYWAAMQARDWALAQAQLAPEAVCRWWATGERFDGAAAVVRVNAVYPEGWTIFLLELAPLGEPGPSGTERVLSLVRVEQDGRSFWANSHFHLGDAGILSIDEYWCDQAEPPPWRPGLSQALAADRRPGLDLSPAAWV